MPGLDFYPAKPATAFKASGHLHPTAAVTFGAPTPVSVGVPFPRGWVGPTELARIKVVVAGKEVPHADTILTLWRNANGSTDGIRSLLVQFRHTFTSRARIVVTVQVSDTPRLPGIPPWEPTADWVPTDAPLWLDTGVREPLVYAVWLPTWMSLCAWKTQFHALGVHPDFHAIDGMLPLFGLTSIDIVDPRVVPINMQGHQNPLSRPNGAYFDAWLYDRASAIYMLAQRTGDIRFYREAHRCAQFYADNLGPLGDFIPKTAADGLDPKYTNPEGLAFCYWLSGDPRMPELVGRLFRFWNYRFTWTCRYQSRPPNVNYAWTERNTGKRIEAGLYDYALNGNHAALTDALELWEDVYGMQNTPRTDSPPATTIWPNPGPRPNTGGLMHTGREHTEGPLGVGPPPENAEPYIASAWMTALLLDQLLQLWTMTRDPRFPAFVFRLADYFRQEGAIVIPNVAGLTPEEAQAVIDAQPASEKQGGIGMYVWPNADRGGRRVPLLYPHYLAGEPTLPYGTGSRPQGYGDFEHAIDVGFLYALAVYFKTMLGQRFETYQIVLSRLMRTHEQGCLNNYVRPDAVAFTKPDPATGLPVEFGYPALRKVPQRKTAWQDRFTQGLSWLARSRLMQEPGLCPRLEMKCVGKRTGDSYEFTVTLLNTGRVDATVFELFSEMCLEKAQWALVGISDGGRVDAGTHMLWKPFEVVAGAVTPVTRSFVVKRLPSAVAARASADRPLDAMMTWPYAYYYAAGDDRAQKPPRVAFANPVAFPWAPP